MARIEIEIPEKFHFSTELIIRIEDVNYGNHMGNEVIANYANEIRMRFLNQLGYPDETRVEGLGLIMTHSIALFKSQGFFGDEIKANIAATNFGRSGFDFVMQFDNVLRDRVLAVALNHMVFYDYQADKVRAIPERFRSFFS